MRTNMNVKFLRAPNAAEDVGGGELDELNDVDLDVNDYDYGEDANLNPADFGLDEPDDDNKPNPDDADDAESTSDGSVDDATRDSDELEPGADKPVVDPRVLQLVQQTGGDEKFAAKFDSYEEYQTHLENTIKAWEKVRPNIPGYGKTEGQPDASGKADDKKAEPFAFKLDPDEHSPELIQQLNQYHELQSGQMNSMAQEVQILRQALVSIAQEAQLQQSHLKDQQFDGWIASLPEYMRADELLGSGETVKLNGNQNASRHRNAIRSHMDMLSEVYASKGITAPNFETLAKQSMYAVMGEQLQKTTEQHTRKKVGADSIRRKKSMQAPSAKSSTKVSSNDADGYGRMDDMLGEMSMQDEDSDMMAFLS